MKSIIANLMLSAAATAILAGLASPCLSQYRVAPPPDTPKALDPRVKIAPPTPVVWGGEDSERSIKVNSSLLLDLCVTQGSLRINGWNRSEVRVYVQNGSKFAFNVREKDARTGDPNWMGVTAVPGRKGTYAASGECISGDEIEIDVPLNTTVNVKGRDITIGLDSIKKASVDIAGGSISMRNIGGGIAAKAGRGDVIVDSSSGPIMLESTTGNIVVFEAKPGDIGDFFKAKTNSGTISMQSVQHRQIEIGSTSGSVLYNGAIRNGGFYRINTNRGTIRLLIPADSNGQLQATFGAGNFSSPDFKFELQTENVTEGPIKTIVGKLGTGGDALIKLTTNNGSINIRKQ